MNTAVNPRHNARLLKALRLEPVDKTPVWIMRQAGRYLPEYREVRAQAGSFMKLCQTPELACEVTLQPLRRFQLDAAILFSDILTIADALGLGLHFVEGEGPKFSDPIQDIADIAKLPNVDIEAQLGYVPAAVRMIRQALPEDLPLLGFAGSPWTLACYMVEGGSSQSFDKLRMWMYQAPDKIAALLEHVANITADYLLAQIEAGVDAVMLFDTWGGLLAPACYRQFSLDPMTKIIHKIKAKTDTPVILFGKGNGAYLADIADSGCQGIGVDWTVDIARARELVNGKVALQGNLDPAVLYASPDIIRAHAHKILSAYGEHPGLIFNLGHGITPKVNPDHLGALIEAVHSY